jgi:competence protein ComEC
VVIAALVWAMVGAFPDGQLRVYTLAVGEGHATLIRTPRGGTILLNGGENPARLRGALGERLPYFQREIDLVILTHPSPTHYAALNGLVNHYTLRQVISFSDLGASTAAQTLRNTFGESAIQWSVLSEGYTLETEDGVRLSFWGRPNAPQSPALIRLSYGDAVFLFATALDASLIAAVESQFVGATVLALPARSLSNLTPNFLARVAPQALLIEAEPASRYKPALPEVTPLFQQMVVVNTAEKGAVEWGTDGKTLRVTTGK